MKSYYANLNEKEKWMVIGTGLFLILYIYYLFLYSPLTNKVIKKSSELSEKIATLKWMQEVKQQHQPNKKKQKVENSQLLTALAAQLKNDNHLIFPYQLQQTGSGDIQLSFDIVPFNSFIAWLEQINNRYVIVIKQFEAERTKTPGTTRLRILLNSA